MTAAAALLILIMTAGPAYAYVDPGAGSFLLQILAAAGVGVLFYARRVRAFLARLFGRTKTGDGKADRTDE